MLSFSHYMSQYGELSLAEFCEQRPESVLFERTTGAAPESPDPDGEKARLPAGTVRFKVGMPGLDADVPGKVRPDADEVTGWIIPIAILPKNSGKRHFVAVGRADGADIRLYDSTVSKRHAYFTFDEEDARRVTVSDAGSSNGTYVNDELVLAHERRLLADGEEVRFGHHKRFLFFTAAGLHRFMQQCAERS